MAKGAIDIEKKVNESLFGEDLSNILENNVHKEKKPSEKQEQKKQEDPFKEMFEEPPEEPPEIKVAPEPVKKEPAKEQKKPAKSKPKPEPKKDPVLIKKADHLPKGVEISEEKAKRLMKNPEVFIIVHEVNKESLVDNSNRSRKTGTQLLNDEMCSKLLNKETNEEILLNKPIFKLGKSNKFADYVIRGNTAVSRRHVEVVTRNGVCYIRDKNSTNGTFIDGIQLPPESEVEIRDGQTLTVANVDFTFRS